MSIFLEPNNFITYTTEEEKEFHELIMKFMYSLNDRGIKDTSLRMNMSSKSKKIFKMRTISKFMMNRWEDSGKLDDIRFKSEEIQGLPYVVLTCKMQITYDTLDGYFCYTIGKQLYNKSDLYAFIRKVVNILQKNNISFPSLDNLLLWCVEENK